jgi:hypothetical protein
VATLCVDNNKYIMYVQIMYNSKNDYSETGQFKLTLFIPFPMLIWLQNYFQNIKSQEILFTTKGFVDLLNVFQRFTTI